MCIDVVNLFFARKKESDKTNRILREVAEGDLSVDLSHLAPASDCSSINGILRKTIAGLKNLIGFVHKSTVNVHDKVSATSFYLEYVMKKRFVKCTKFSYNYICS